jgi:hypothetical protein
MPCARGSCRWISRLNVSQLSQTVEGLELVFGEWSDRDLVSGTDGHRVADNALQDIRGIYIRGLLEDRFDER